MRRSGDRRLGFSLAFTSLRVWALSRRLDVTGAVPGSLSSRGGLDQRKNPIGRRRQAPARRNAARRDKLVHPSADVLIL